MMLLLLILFISALIFIWGSYIMPVLVAIVLAYLLDSSVDRLEQQKLSRALATTIVMVLFVGVTLIGTWLKNYH